MRTLTGLVVLFTVAAGFLFAQQPEFRNAQPTSRSAAAGLESEFRTLAAGQTGLAWIGYAVPMIPGEHHLGCGDTLLEGRASASSGKSEGGLVKLEGDGSLFVLYRIQDGKVQKIRSFSEDCRLDAGGLPVFWLTEVKPAESVSLLATFAVPQSEESQNEKKRTESALAAAAFHRDPAADRLLEQLAAPGQPEYLRERTAFWLGVARGSQGYEVLRRMIKEDPSQSVRDKVVFALSLSSVPEATDLMIETARGDASAHVRAQALFWLAQKAGKKAEGAITAAIENDPDTDVKKRAVFALSQLPKDEGVPRLIEVARTNRNPVVRKQAIFWLGQSKDPRALSFFEEILQK